MAQSQPQPSEKFPPQRQSRQPGLQADMQPEPISITNAYQGSHKLRGKVALISGGDSGIGRAVAVHYARENAMVGFIYRSDSEKDDAEETRRLIEAENADACVLQGDVGDRAFCKHAVEQVVAAFGALDILVNNAGEQHVQQEFDAITPEQLQRTFATNIFGYFYLAQAALPYLEQTRGAIINTGSVTSFKGNPILIDYTSTKGAIQAFTFALAKALAKKNIRVNEIAPGPIWTPLIPSSFSADRVAEFGKDTLMGRAGQPCEVAPAYVFLASADSSYITGQIVHVNGGGYLGV
jgi:NAD(P)-dependent dehydrogenase (short-subunit alcohol dehydrogenase family)